MPLYSPNLNLQLMIPGEADWHTIYNASMTILDLAALKDHADVNPAMAPTDLQVLQYDASSGKWTAGTPGTALGDEKVKVGVGGTPDYLNDTDFSQDVSNHVQINRAMLRKYAIIFG
jgi:hypothetical protein